MLAPWSALAVTAVSIQSPRACNAPFVFLTLTYPSQLVIKERVPSRVSCLLFLVRTDKATVVCVAALRNWPSYKIQ